MRSGRPPSSSIFGFVRGSRFRRSKPWLPVASWSAIRDGGGAEYLTPDVSFPIPEGDSTEFPRTVEEVAHEYEGRSSRLATLMHDCAELVRRQAYTLEKQDQDVLSVFGRYRIQRKGTGRRNEVALE